jgi:hypothetical protein
MTANQIAGDRVLGTYNAKTRDREKRRVKSLGATTGQERADRETEFWKTERERFPEDWATE